MSEPATSTTPAPVAPINGAQSKQMGVPPVPPQKPSQSSNGTSAPQAGAMGVTRGPDGKFLPQNGTASATEAPKAGEATATPKPRIKIKDLEVDEDAAHSEIMRGRQALKTLTDSQKFNAQAEQRLARAEALEQKYAAADAWREKLNSDPEAFFKDAGLTPEQERAILSKRLYGHLQSDEMTPEQRELQEYKAKLSRYEEAEKSAAQKAEEDAHNSQVENQRATIHAEIMEALEGGRVPKARSAVQRMAQKVALFEEKNQPISISQAAEFVRADLVRETGHIINDASIDELIEVWGQSAYDAFEKKVQTRLLAKLQNRSTPQVIAKPQLVRPSGDKQAKTITEQEFRARHSKVFKR